MEELTLTNESFKTRFLKFASLKTRSLKRIMRVIQFIYNVFLFHFMYVNFLADTIYNVYYVIIPENNIKSEIFFLQIKLCTNYVHPLCISDYIKG